MSTEVANAEAKDPKLGSPLAAVVIGIVATFALVTFAWPAKDYRALFDEQVETIWLHGREQMAAEEFFAGGGVFENSVDSDEPIDQRFVVPLILRLKEQHALDPQVILDPEDTKRAFALIAPVPTDPASRNAIRSTILEAAEDFPGLLYQHWGRQWLTLDFFDEREIAPMKQAGVLEKLQDGQRLME